MADKPSKSHSPLRSLMAEASGSEYAAFAGVEAARANPDSVAVFEGDDGGTIYLTVPVRLIRCDEAKLQQLLLDIDAMYWKDSTMAHLVYEPRPVGSSVAGGMGGGRVVDGVWLHPKIEELVVKADVEAVIAGRRSRLGDSE
jgi:hypothetical protein